MNETNPLPEPPPDQAPTGAPENASNTLMDLIIAFLTPMFLTVTGGDIHFARTAAAETLTAYRTRNHIDLIAVAQIIACGLTALGSLSLSMADDLSLSMTLRLRGNAVALNRAAEQNRRALAQPATNQAPQPTGTTDPDASEFEAQVLASLAATQKPTTKVQPPNPDAPATQQIATASSAPPKIPPFAAVASSTATELTDRQRQAQWAFAMTDVAGEFTTSLKNLPPAERKTASNRAAALNSCANQLLLGNVPPPLELGDLAAIIRHTAPR